MKKIICIVVGLLIAYNGYAFGEERKHSSDLLLKAFTKKPMICFQNSSNLWVPQERIRPDGVTVLPNQYAAAASCDGFTKHMKVNYSGWENRRYYATGGGYFYEGTEWDIGSSPEQITVLQSQQKEASNLGQKGTSWQCKIAWLSHSKIGSVPPPADFFCTVQCCAYEEDIGVLLE